MSPKRSPTKLTLSETASAPVPCGTPSGFSGLDKSEPTFSTTVGATSNPAVPTAPATLVFEIGPTASLTTVAGTTSSALLRIS